MSSLLQAGQGRAGSWVSLLMAVLPQYLAPSCDFKWVSRVSWRCRNVSMSPRRSHQAVSFIYVPAIRGLQLERKENSKRERGEDREGKARKKGKHCSLIYSCCCCSSALHSTRRWWIIDTNINLCAATAPSLPATPSRPIMMVNTLNQRQLSRTAIQRGKLLQWLVRRLKGNAANEFSAFQCDVKVNSMSAVWMQNEWFTS